MVDVKAHQCFLVTMLDNLGVYTLGIGIIQDLGGHRFNMFYIYNHSTIGVPNFEPYPWYNIQLFDLIHRICLVISSSVTEFCLDLTGFSSLAFKGISVKSLQYLTIGQNTTWSISISIIPLSRIIRTSSYSCRIHAHHFLQNCSFISTTSRNVSKQIIIELKIDNNMSIAFFLPVFYHIRTGLKSLFLLWPCRLATSGGADPASIPEDLEIRTWERSSWDD